MMEFLKKFTSEEGYLTDKGLIPLGDDKLKAVRASVLASSALQL